MSFEDPTSDARFVYELAEHLHKTVSELTGSMGTVELAGWKAFFAVRQREDAHDAAASRAGVRHG